VERAEGEFLQENSEESAVGAVIPDSVSDTRVSTPATIGLPKRLPDELKRAVDELWSASDAPKFGLSQAQFGEIMLQAGEAQGWGEAEGEGSPSSQARFLKSLRIEELILARACAAGNEVAWGLFLARYRKVLYRAAYAIARQESAGRELADSLYADLYGLAEGGGTRRSRLESYMGRGSLAGWLRAVLAQRFVDNCRRTRREISLDEQEADGLPAAPVSNPEIPNEDHLAFLARSIAVVLTRMNAEEHLLLVSYYLDGRALRQIAELLAVHESTISRRIERLTGKLRKALVKELQRSGLSERAAREALGTDVRDITVNVRKLLQTVQQPSFKEGETETG
jgi:RNA polymerase sigma-70 factor, ECF subfamily